MQKRKYNDIAKEIRSVLLTYPSAVTLEEFLKSYKGLVGERLPSRALGYQSDVELLQSMPNVVNVCSDSSGKVLLTGIADETSEHIQKLVSKQRKSQPKKSSKGFSRPRMSNSYYNMSKSHYNIRDQQFLSGPLRAEILNLMSFYHQGIAFSTFVIAYHKKYNKYLPLSKGLESLEDMINLIPELQVRTMSNEKAIYFANNCLNGNHQESSVTGNNIVHPPQTEVKKYKHPSINIHKSGIPEDVLQNIQQLLQKYPKGIVDVNFLSLYEGFTTTTFDLFELGYKSLLDLVDALPDVCKRVRDSNEGKNWIILPAEADVERSPEGRNSTSVHSKMQTSSLTVREGVPADVASPSLQFIRPKIPENLDLNDYIPVYISSIINPCLFWFRLQTDDAIEQFEKFEKDMGHFYNNYADYKYTMKDCDIVIGATCVVCNPEDGLWYRGIIKSIPSIKLVNVSFVDYGSRENVPRANLYYVRSVFHGYPAYAFKAQLSGVKPPKNESTWSTKAINRFIELCKCLSLMACLKPVDKDTFSADICNTNGESDIHLNDTLIKEGFAEIYFENKSDVGYHSLPDDCKEDGNTFDGNTSESAYSSESLKENHHISQSDETSSLSDSDVQKLVVSFKQQVNDGGDSNILEDLKGQVAKRYVKPVQLCEEYKFHVINLENKLYMTSGEVAKLIWSEKDSGDLIDRLSYKEVDVPFCRLSKKNYPSVFEQCIWYKIPEYEKLESSSSSLILYSLDCAFDILNVFGHPSICLRLAIQNEMKNFDPSDPIWNEFTYDESSELSDDEKEIEKELHKLCVYDLKTKKEVYKVKRIKLQMANAASAAQEIKKLDTVLNIIARRIKDIETICSQFSSYT